MVISAEPPPAALPSDPTAEGGAGEAGGAAVEAVMTPSSARRGALSSLPSTLKTWGSHRMLRCAPVNRAGDAIAPARRSSSQQLDEVSERLLLGLREAAAAAPGGGASAADDDESPGVVEAASPRPSKARTRRRRRALMPPSPAPAASASPQASERERRLVRADALGRARFSATLSAEEIEEDVYALTGARPRRRPRRRRPRPVQKQLDMLLPGAWLSEITAEFYRVPDDR
ncbi:hypothetical protein CFC21_039339 [Triticum aestivum]|uniref:DUF1639 domain-containing protein n=2 Tax=Triticum aestivum TaxID=4565 RepID=A0A3B6FFI0_WHEAT|nr:uncharacterized protein LOC119280614 [Triticum dicoccoides]XP_044343925.1 uncharacterized protein LOC123064523 [Triticum aestivum]KAF7027286.1 hypothetical protein CFC21_039339 [Triticum aestivum]